MLAHLHGRDRDEGMIMIRRGTEYGVDRFLLIEHLAEILVLRALVVLVLLLIVLLGLGNYRLATALALVIERLKIRHLGHIAHRHHLRIRLGKQRPSVCPALAT